MSNFLFLPLIHLERLYRRWFDRLTAELKVGQSFNYCQRSLGTFKNWKTPQKPLSQRRKLDENKKLTKIDVLGFKFSGFLINWREIHRPVGVSLMRVQAMGGGQGQYCGCSESLMPRSHLTCYCINFSLSVRSAGLRPCFATDSVLNWRVVSFYEISLKKWLSLWVIFIEKTSKSPKNQGFPWFSLDFLSK